MNALTACRAGLVLSVIAVLATLPLVTRGLEYLLVPVGWSIVLIVSTSALRFARKVPSLMARTVDVHAPKEEGFRMTAKSAEVHRIALGVGEEAFVNLAAGIATTGSLCLALLTYGAYFRSEGSIAFGAIGSFFWVAAVPIAAYVVLQSRRSIVIERERITVRDWLGIPRRILLDEGASVELHHVFNELPPGHAKGDAFRVEIHVGQKRLFVARSIGRDAEALVGTLSASIREVSGLEVSEGYANRFGSV